MIVLPPPVSEISIVQVLAAAIAVALTSVLVAVANSIRRKMRVAKLLAPVPGPKGTFLLGLLPELNQNIDRCYDFLTDLAHKFGGRVHIPWNIFTGNMLFLTDAADLEYVLSTNLKNWVKSDHFRRSIHEVFGIALLGLNHAHTVDGGAMFRLQRKVTSKIFTTSNFKVFTESIFQRYALRLVDIINAQNGKVDMYTIANQYTLQATFDIVVGVPLESIDKELGLKFIKSMDVVFGHIAQRAVFKPYFKYLWWCMPSEYRYQREAKVLLDTFDGIVRQRLKEPEEDIAIRSDVLSLFIKKARELEAEGDRTLDIRALRSIATGTIFGGRDTTSAVITYSFYNLAQYPKQQSKILEELKSIDTSALTFEAVKKLRYLDAFVWETLRLYPAVPSVMKVAAEDDVFPDGTFIPAGTEVMVSAYYMGRHNTKLWGEDLLVFRPQRWLDMKTRPTAYDLPVFLGGPRMCPAMNLALLEAKIFIAILLQTFHVKIQNGEQVKDRPYVTEPTLVMKGGLPLQLTLRQAAAHQGRSTPPFFVG